MERDFAAIEATLATAVREGRSFLYEVEVYRVLQCLGLEA